jgi:hypothetical protein
MLKIQAETRENIIWRDTKMSAHEEDTGIHRALPLAGEAGPDVYESADTLYRLVPLLRELLPREAKRQLAVAFEWAREGIVKQGATTPELEALHAAYGYARDVMLAALEKTGN